MKTYDVHRGPHCPTGKHETEPGATQPNPNCDCIWMVVGSSTPVPHTTGFNRRELERLVKEADDGFFDPAHLPPRHGSRFLSPFLQRLLELAEGDPMGAAQQLLASLVFDQVAWDSATGCLSLRQRKFTGAGIEHEWLQLWLRGDEDREQWVTRADEAGGEQATIDGLWFEPLAIEEGPGRIELDDASRARMRSTLMGELKQRLDVPAEIDTIPPVPDPFNCSDEDVGVALRAAVASVQQEFIDPLIADGTVPPGTTLAFDEMPIDQSPPWQDEPLPFEQLPEPVAVGQVFKHRLRARWVVVQYLDETAAVVSPVDAAGTPTRGRRATVTLEPGATALKMYDRVYPGGPGRADL